MEKFGELYEKAHNMVLSNPENSIAILEEILELDRNNKEILHDLVYAYCKLKRYEVAKTYFLQYEKNETDIGRMNCVRGYLEYHIGNLDLAIGAYTNAIKIDRYNLIANIDLGYSYLANLEFEKAKHVFCRAYKIKKNYYCIIGFLISQMGLNEAPDIKVIKSVINIEKHIYNTLIEIYKNNNWNWENAIRIVSIIR